MIITTSEVLKNYRGELLKNAEQRDMTIGQVIELSCLATIKGDEDLGFEAKVKLHKLAARAIEGEAEYSLPELTQIQERVGKMWPPVVCGAVKEIFDPSPKAARFHDLHAKKLDGIATDAEAREYDALHVNGLRA